MCFGLGDNWEADNKAGLGQSVDLKMNNKDGPRHVFSECHRMSSEKVNAGVPDSQSFVPGRPCSALRDAFVEPCAWCFRVIQELGRNVEDKANQEGGCSEPKILRSELKQEQIPDLVSRSADQEPSRRRPTARNCRGSESETHQKPANNTAQSL